jgi:hypothetical protein
LKQSVSYDDAVPGVTIAIQTFGDFEEEGLENLARYIIRASFSQELVTYIPTSNAADGTAKLLYESKSLSSTRSGNGKTQKEFYAIDWPRF